MSKKRKRQNKKSNYTPLQRHVKTGSKLTPPLGGMNIQTVEWERDLLPEHLWIASLAEEYSLSKMHVPFYDFMDAFDEYVSEGQDAIGLISDFILIPEDRRDDFKNKYRELIKNTFQIPLGRIVTFYPECPAYWLVDKNDIEKNGPLDPEVELGRLRNLVLKLLPAKDDFAGHIRVLPFCRALKHGKVFISRESGIGDILLKYPNKCDKNEKFLAQSVARTNVNFHYDELEIYKDKKWPKYFWRHNYDLTVCKPYNLTLRGSKPVTEQEFDSIVKTANDNFNNLQKYIESLKYKAKCDLYNPLKDEILFGLFSRTARLYLSFLENPILWSRDISGIYLRSLANVAITFSYLAQHGTEKEFLDFKSYGEGQEKLLMLQLQDNYPEKSSLEGRDMQSIAEELGGFSTELLEIEFGHWAKKNDRQLAKLAGLEDMYRLIFTPTSGDLHGNWASLKSTSLCRCIEPLHRFHRLPSISQPPLYLNVLVAAQDIFKHCLEIAQNKVGFPKMEHPLVDITSRE